MQTYIDQFRILNGASAGVILTRTREPHRVLEALREFAHLKGKIFYHWNIVNGWELPTRPDQKRMFDSSTDPYEALGLLNGTMTQGPSNANAFSTTATSPPTSFGSSPQPSPSAKPVATIQDPEDFIGAMVGLDPFIGNHPPLDEQLRLFSREFPETAKRLVVIVHEGFVLPPRLQHDIPILDFDLPTKEELAAVYNGLVEAVYDEHAKPLKTAEVEALVSLGAGMTEAEFELACAKAFSSIGSLKKVTWKAVSKIVSVSKTEIIRRSEVLELMESVDPGDIGGLEQLKHWISRRKKLFTNDARKKKIDAPKGVVLIGPPGTGKSMCAKAIAGELQQPLIKFDIGRVFGSLVGETEGRVRSALKMVEAMSPCVVLLDEVDKAGIDPRQSGGDGGVSKRVMGSILTFMQECTSPMFWVLTANRPESLPAELLRKGRMDEVFSVLPPTAIERKEIIRIHLERRGHKLPCPSDLKLLIAQSKGYVGAEIEAAIKEANVDAYDKGVELTGAMISEHLSHMKPISVAFKEDFDRMLEWASNNARPSSNADAVEDSGEARPTRRIRKVEQN